MPDLRLTYIAELVRQGSRVADIGTDHAHLPVFLVQTGRCVSAIATDIRQGPLQNAQTNVEAAGLSTAITIRGGDGLQPVDPAEVDDIVIAGMGGETIAAILQAASWVQNQRYRLVLQPMSRAEDLRKYLLTNGFEILSERSLCEGGHLYTIMAVAYTDAAPVEDPLAWYVGGLSPQTDAEFLQKQKERLSKKAEGLARSGEHQAECAALQELLKRMEAFL